MVPPIALGTLLRQRYLIQAILGQGGFGRTYLAIDRERFDEKCVLKEFSVPYDDEALVKKSQTLFHREASTLYQIQHPQVPRFWAAFEEEQRLFLVQDFVEGYTYRHLLQERQQRGETFSEVEVLFLLEKILPVLTYLHDRGIIHRDLSLENIILRPDPAIPDSHVDLAMSGLPVIIDFGAVKEATTHWPLTSAITRVGKVGYAPPEQLQTGKVYPNSDLYSLAATCLVLLTAKEPRSLVDGQTLSWQWQPHTTISDELAKILQRMLSVYPGDRYPTAPAVYQDLQPLLTQSSTQVQGATAIPPTPNPSVVFPGPSLPVLAPFKREPTAERSQPKFAPAETYLEPRSLFQAPTNRRLRLGMLISLLIGTSVAGTWLWQKWFNAVPQTGDVWISGTKVPRSEASKIIGSQGVLSGNSIQPADLHQQTISLQASPPQVIQFPPEKISTSLEGTLQENATQSYVLNASKGQILTTTLNGSGVVMSVLRSDQEGIDAAAYQTRSWTGELPDDGQYLIQVAGSGHYLLDVALTPISRPTQDRTDRLSFARGTNGTTVTGSITPQQVRRYLLKAKRGQFILIKVIEGTVNFSAIAPDGDRLGGTTATTREWKGQLPTEGDYVIEVVATQAEDFALSVEIF